MYQGTCLESKNWFWFPLAALRIAQHPAQDLKHNMHSIMHSTQLAEQLNLV